MNRLSFYSLATLMVALLFSACGGSSYDYTDTVEIDPDKDKKIEAAGNFAKFMSELNAALPKPEEMDTTDCPMGVLKDHDLGGASEVYVFERPFVSNFSPDSLGNYDYRDSSGGNWKWMTPSGLTDAWEYHDPSKVDSVTFYNDDFTFDKVSEAYEDIMNTGLVGIYYPVLRMMPEMTSSEEFDTGLMIGYLAIVKVETKEVVCNSILSCMSSENISYTTYSSSSGVNTSGQSALTRDFQSNYKTKVKEVMGDILGRTISVPTGSTYGY